MKTFFRFALYANCALALLVTAACSTTPSADSRAADEAAIRKADSDSLQAIASKQLDATVAFYDDAATLFIPNAPIVTGTDEIRRAWVQMFAVPSFSLTPKTTRIEIARSGDLAYMQGVYDATANGTTDRGKFVVVWKKQADGAWRIAADIWNSDLPVAAPTK
jgi:ketosteroid isomerase-like protein